MKVVVDMPRAGAYGSTHVTTELYFNESNQVVGEAVMSEMGYGGPQATKIVGITYRQLDYWTRTGLVVPSIKSAEGSGTQRVYSFNDLLQLKVIKELIDAGASLQKVRQSIEYVRENIEGDWSKVTIATDGDRVYACTSDAEVLDLLRSGQGVLGSLVSVEKVKEQLDGTLAELRPTAEELTYGSPGHEEELRAKEG